MYIYNYRASRLTNFIHINIWVWSVGPGKPVLCLQMWKKSHWPNFLKCVKLFVRLGKENEEMREKIWSALFAPVNFTSDYTRRCAPRIRESALEKRTNFNCKEAERAPSIGLEEKRNESSPTFGIVPLELLTIEPVRLPGPEMQKSWLYFLPRKRSLDQLNSRQLFLVLILHYLFT